MHIESYQGAAYCEARDLRHRQRKALAGLLGLSLGTTAKQWSWMELAQFAASWLSQNQYTSTSQNITNQ
jgi:hypothetical protein